VDWSAHTDCGQSSSLVILSAKYSRWCCTNR